MNKFLNALVVGLLSSIVFGANAQLSLTNFNEEISKLEKNLM